MITALETRDEPTARVCVRDLGGEANEVRDPRDRQCEAAERVEPVRVEPGREQHHVGPDPCRQPRKHPAVDRQDAVVVRPRGEGHVDGRAPSCARARVGFRARARIKPRLV